MLKKNLPNLFDQYSQDENRFTNALLQTLAASPRLTQSFLKEFLGLDFRPGKGSVELSSQKKPVGLGDRGKTDVERRERDTVPDGWILCGEKGWGVVIESKCEPKSLDADQLNGHLRQLPTAQRCLLVLTPDESEPEEVLSVRRRNAAVIWKPWREVHAWVGFEVRRAKGETDKATFLLKTFKEFLEMNEKLSGFQGIDFSDGYSPLRAKAILKALMDELHPEVLKLYRELTGRRGKILAEAGVWDVFGIEPKFTGDLHFTIGISEQRTEVGLTVPNSARSRWRNFRRIMEDDDLFAKFQGLLRDLRTKGNSLWFHLLQRHYPTLTRGIADAVFDFNLDTADFLPPRKPVLKFPMWFKTSCDVIRSKRGINLQVIFQVRFPHDDGYKGAHKLRTREFLDVAHQILKDFRPLYEFLRTP